ncbi:hypothetical protein VCSRO40_2358 [Vibrio cholerae]|nr:hypothetical protein VCSRO40_2358 [Vibrio cholerae]
MRKTSINSFFEKMDPEFESGHITLDKQGYKVDGHTGIKKHFNFDGQKSVDYFHCCSNRGFMLIEFSDLMRQDEQLKFRIKSIKKSNLENSEKRKQIKSLLKTIHQELNLKYKDSLTILSSAIDEFCDVPEEFSSLPRFVVVIAPDLSDCKSKQIEIVRFIDELQNKIRPLIPHTICRQVNVICLNSFAS